MGADIHIYSETRKDQGWIADQADTFTIEQEDDYTYCDMKNAPGRGRDYWFFGLLAGVRTYWPFQFPEPKGLPDDLSDQVSRLAKYWEDGGHSCSWLTRAELIAKRNELFLLRGEVLIAPNPDYEVRHLDHLIGKLDQQITDLKALSPDVADEDHRVVFWFDN